jgi:Ca2+-binding EF-hand superfamily protein
MDLVTEAEAREEAARTCFAAHDVDGNGVIDTVELKVALRTLGVKSNDETDVGFDVWVDGCLGHFDADNDGVLSFDYFARLYNATKGIGTGRSPEELVGILRAGTSEDEATVRASTAIGLLAGNGQASEVVAAGAVAALLGVLLTRTRTQEASTKATWALGKIASNGHAAALLIEAGAVEALVGMMRAGRPEQQATAAIAFTLRCLVRTVQGAAAAIVAGAAEVLVGVLRTGKPEQKATANAGIALVHLLRNLAVHGQAAAVAEAGAVEALVRVLRAGKPEQQATANAAMALAMLLHSGQVGPMAETDEVVKLVVEVVRILVEDLRLGQLDQQITLHAAIMLGNLAEMGQAVAIVKEGAVEALVKLMAAGELEQKLTTKIMSALANLAVHESLRATLRRAGVLEPLAHKLNTGGLEPQARFSGLTAVAMLYGEDATNEAVNALLSRHNVAVLAVAVMRSALEETVCNELGYRV